MMPDETTPQDDLPTAGEVGQSEIARFVEQSSIPIMALDRDLRYVFANAAYCKAFSQPKDQLIGRPLLEVFELSPESAESFKKNCALTFQGHTTHSEVQTALVTRRDGRTRPLYWQATLEPLLAPDGTVEYAVQRIQKVTHLVELQKSHDVIATELDHRVKNFVSVILATARITSLSAESVEQYTDDFCSRVDSMARIYGRMSADGLKGLQLRSLFEDELAQVAAKRPIRYSLSGDDIQLTLKATKDGGMVIHEFVDNAVKHGCFSRPEGQLDVTWAVADDHLRILWVESGLSGIKTPEKTGFGTRLTDMLPNAKVSRTYRDSGLTIEYVVPLEVATSENDQNEDIPAEDN